MFSVVEMDQLTDSTMLQAPVSEPVSEPVAVAELPACADFSDCLKHWRSIEPRLKDKIRSYWAAQVAQASAKRKEKEGGERVEVVADKPTRDILEVGMRMGKEVMMKTYGVPRIPDWVC